MAISGHEDTLAPPELAATMAAFPEVEAGAAGPPAGIVAGPARFAPGAVLGQGGMGTVYVARDEQFGREVALKEMTTEVASADAVRRFLVEAIVTGNLEHPGIPAVYERGVKDGRPFYAMRRVEGRTLSDAVTAARGFEARLALLPSVVQVAHTLGFAHQRGVVHRDVKPDNVVLGEHGETVLLDWGIARVRGTDFGDSAVQVPSELETEGTVAGAVMGTPAYMAPEQAAGRVDAIDERTDVFALGAMLYHVLTGAPPYEGPTGLAVLARALQGERPSLDKAAPETPEPLRAIVERAMAGEPGQRFADAREFADALQGFLTSKVRDAPSAMMRVMGTVVGLVVIGLAISAAIGVGSTISSFEEQGTIAYSYLVLACMSGVLAAIEWWTKGRNRLSPLILAMAMITVLAGLSSLGSGFGVVMHYLQQQPEGTDLMPILIAGMWEVSGNLPLSALMATIQVSLWAVVHRLALLARDDAERERA